MEDLKVRLIGYKNELTFHPFMDEVSVIYVDYDRLKVGLTGVYFKNKEKKHIRVTSDYSFNIEVDMQDIVNWRQIFLKDDQLVYINYNESFIDKAYNWYCKKIKNRKKTINDDLV